MFLFLLATACYQISTSEVVQVRPVVIVPNIKLFFGPPAPSTSKFPPVIELLVQRIQAQFSSYVYEDLSRPATWDKPVYTLSSEEAATATATVSQNIRGTTEPTQNFVEASQDEEKPQAVNVENNYGTLVVYLKNFTDGVGKTESVPMEDLGNDGKTRIVAKIQPDMDNLVMASVQNAGDVNKTDVVFSAVFNITVKLPLNDNGSNTSIGQS